MDLLNKVQKQPYETRLKILWSIVSVVAVILVVLIIKNIKDTVSNANGNIIQIEGAKYVPDSTVAYATVESVEQDDKSVKIYFNFNNPGDDILNVPRIADISLAVDKNTIHPQKITDRQDNPFVQKILSHTQNFGTLIFQPVTGTHGTLIFDQMFLEKNPADVFQQRIWMDLEKLRKKVEIRN